MHDLQDNGALPVYSLWSGSGNGFQFHHHTSNLAQSDPAFSAHGPLPGWALGLRARYGLFAPAAHRSTETVRSAGKWVAGFRGGGRRSVRPSVLSVTSLADLAAYEHQGRSQDFRQEGA